ncbi:MAG: NADH-ubiquinone oxidoreductase-F iron-sulfur binding region domain-containing protein [Nocardioides sp.]
MTAASPVPVPDEIRVLPGPALLAGIDEGPSLAAHRARHGTAPAVTAARLLALTADARLRGRGGAAFPFSTKLAAASRGRRPVVVVNLSEGEPASSKDSALALTRPHLVLDGAVAAAGALGARDVHVVLPGDRPHAAERMAHAIAERDDRVRFRQHRADARFVSGQARAVVELLAGRSNLPVVAWAPEAVAGLHGRPTLLSNAETWAHVGLLVLDGEAAYTARGRVDEPGTTLLTVTAPGQVPHVHEVEYGARLRDVLPSSATGGPLLVGGFHGSWATWSTVASARVSVPGMAALGMPLGAGVVLAPGPGTCPLALTSQVVDHLAGQSSGRCGPCLNGLPALAATVRAALTGSGGERGAVAEIERLSRLVERRGACAHPDGTARLVRSLLRALPGEVAAHGAGGCDARTAEAA